MFFRMITLCLLFSSTQFAAEKSRILESDETFSILAIDKAEYKVYKKIYIADEKGKDLAYIRIGASDYIDFKSASVRLFDKDGKRRGRYKKKHFSELKSSGNGIVGTDDISFLLNLSSSISTPFTIELEYTQIFHSLFFWPAWYPQETIPVVETSYTVIAPGDYPFQSFSPSGLEGVKESDNSMVWHQANLPPYPDESSMPVEVYDQYRVFFTASNFQLDHYSGSSTSWNSIADFYEKLSKTQYVLDRTLISDLDLSTSSTLRDTISQIYEYVQHNTRYVGMELGVHGWKPHTSQWVCENKYGDCKDLATFFISILRQYYIESYPVLIRTRNSGYIYPEFPDDRFNHVIACVPLQDDTLWVDCTWDDGRIDIIPESDQGCNVVVVGGKGPVFTQTPIQGPEQYSSHFVGELELHQDGAANLKGQIELKGQASLQARGAFQSINLTDLREAVLYLFRETAPGLELDTFSVSDLADKYKPIIITLAGRIPHFATKTGTRLLVFPALPARAGWHGEHPSRRSKPYFNGIPSLSSAEIDIRYTDALVLESSIPDVDISNEFGTIRQSITSQANLIHYSWLKLEKMMVVEIADYEPYYSFRLKAKQAHASPLVFQQR